MVITNDAWFGRSAAAYQHAAIAKLRAVECRLPVARCANTGISGFIDPWGRYFQRTGLLERVSVVGTLASKPAQSAFVRWGQWLGGPLGFLLFCVCCTQIPYRRSRKKRHE